MSDNTVIVKYVGAAAWFESSVTGRPTKWLPNQSDYVSPDVAIALAATGLFEVGSEKPVMAVANPVTGGVELIGPDGEQIDAVVVSDPAVGEVVRKTETGWETVGEIATIINNEPAVGDVPVWNGTEYVNTPSGIKYVEQTGGDYVPGTSYGDVPGASITLTGLKKGAIVCVFAEATMQTNAGTITVGIHNGSTVKQAFTSTSTAGETKAIINNSTTGVVQDGFLGNFWLLPAAADGGMTIKMQARHSGATTPAVRSANIRAFVLNIPGAV